MVGATTILGKHLLATSMGGLRLHTSCSPVMGGITFLLGTTPPLFTGVVLFPLALVSFPMSLHWLLLAEFFWARNCALLWCIKNTDHPPVWIAQDLSSALGRDHLLPLQSLLLHPDLLHRHLP
jgi:hypothetical protein